jgi:hypothetical protein
MNARFSRRQVARKNQNTDVRLKFKFLRFSFSFFMAFVIEISDNCMFMWIFTYVCYRFTSNFFSAHFSLITAAAVAEAAELIFPRSRRFFYGSRDED